MAGPDLCLVTGASGFIGGHLVQRLVDDGFRVRCLVRASSDTAALERLDVELATGDLTSPQTLARATEDCSYVLHCGAMVSDWATPSEIASVNVGGTRALLGASAQAGVQRFVHFSSTDVYGYPGGVEVDESYVATGFSNWYAQTKLAAEAEVRRAAAAHHGLETVILRPATVYGPGSREVVLEIARAIRGRQMVLIDGGRAVTGLCYVANLIDAALPALRHEQAVGQAFNLSDGLDVTWRRFADDLAAGLGCAGPRLSLPYRVAEAIGFSLEHGYRALRRATGLTTRPLLSRQAVQVMGIDQRFSTAKARALLGWAPRVDYQAGLAATLDWLRSEGV